LEAFLISTGIVALAEIGDKTQLLAFILAAKFRRPVPIIFGILVATIVNHAFAGALGAWITSVIGPQSLRWVLGVSFIAMAIWTLIPDKFEEGDSKLARFGVFGVSGGGPHAAACAHALGPRLLGAAIVSGVAPPDTPGVHDGMMPVNRVNFALARQSHLLALPVMAAMLFALRHFPDQTLDGMLRGLPEPDRRILSRREIADMLIAEARHASPTAARAAAQDFSLFARPWRFRLEDIAVPVHVWHGDLDVNVPVSHGRSQADRIPNAKLHLCPGEGHLLFIERAAEILRTVSGHAPAGAAGGC